MVDVADANNLLYTSLSWLLDVGSQSHVVSVPSQVQEILPATQSETDERLVRLPLESEEWNLLWQ